jgi:putative endonuclease
MQSSSSSKRPRPRNDAEVRAARWYRLHGYRILDTNCRLGGGELDVVARRGRSLVFCEVKSRAGDGWGDAVEMVDERKIGRVRSAAAAWRARRPELASLHVRYDVIAVQGRRLEHLPDAF